MNFKCGQGIFGRLPFKDGKFPVYDRPYLIVGVTSNSVEVLNVSSIRGKERKLAFPTNEKLLAYNPPFKFPSFVKLDSLVRVPISDLAAFRVLDNGKTLDIKELDRIKKKLNKT